MLALYSKNGIWKFLLNLGLERAFSSQHPRLHLLYSSLYVCVYIQWCHCLWHYKVQFKKHGSYPVLLRFTYRLRCKTHWIHRLVSGLIWKPEDGGTNAQECACSCTRGARQPGEKLMNHQTRPWLCAWGFKTSLSPPCIVHSLPSGESP